MQAKKQDYKDLVFYIGVIIFWSLMTYLSLNAHSIYKTLKGPVIKPTFEQVSFEEIKFASK